MRRALPCGDYGLAFGGRLVASVERKSLADLAMSLTSGRLRYTYRFLAAARVWAAAKYGTPGKPSIPSRRRNRSSRQGCLNAEHRPPRPPRLKSPIPN